MKESTREYLNGIREDRIGWIGCLVALVLLIWGMNLK